MGFYFTSLYNIQKHPINKQNKHINSNPKEKSLQRRNSMPLVTINSAKNQYKILHYVCSDNARDMRVNIDSVKITLDCYRYDLSLVVLFNVQIITEHQRDVTLHQTDPMPRPLKLLVKNGSYYTYL
jgi:hypothetical protein